MKVLGLARVLRYFRAHRKGVTALAVVATVFIATDTGSVLAFHQSTEADGVRVATDKEAYGIGQTITVTMYLVNKLDQDFDACIGWREVLFRGPFGISDGLGTFIDYSPDPHCGNIQPGSERLEANTQWRLFLPGVYTIMISMSTVGSTSLTPGFRGNATIFVAPLA